MVNELAVFVMFLGSVFCLLLMLGIVLLILIKQIIALNKDWLELIERNQALREFAKPTSENVRELLCGLQAEKAHVEQLQRKVHLMQVLLDELQARFQVK
ncbi:hypothetical protein [Pseudomonas sp. N040]|uniref:hypothetical protein n=1 Tax=Pseudomonas sp. N040 TaxID=2785325 RepID=UPI0018A267D0|nr:hypothetical protein [Pseudomonas sp. N040]MBF7728619.1 hypothetical protein [Pseudomonas sp. N040]MBW7012259.1 hypothetical protein [Pseudomonas sp. N040]